jgi:tetratricopeptide (TPR) repeat protein
MSDLDTYWATPEVRELRERAEAAEADGDLDAALRAWDELVARHPAGLGGWSLRGLFLERRGRHADALASFRRSTAIRANYPDHYNAATMLLHLGRPAEALAELDACIACDDRRAEAWCNRGISLTQLGRHAEARASFERAESLDDRLANAFRCHAILLAQLGERDAAATRRARVAALEPASAASHLDLAHALAAAHDDHHVHWEPGGIEEQIVEAIERGLALACSDRQRRWGWTEKVWRLQRIAHGRQASRRAGLAIDERPAIARYLAAAAAAAGLFPDEAWFSEQLADARSLAD